MGKEQLIFVRNDRIKSEQRTLPADYYNYLHLIFAQANTEHVFIPIRSMQFIAAIDKSEIIFVHSANKSYVQLSWNHFKPQERETLTDVVPFQCDFYEREHLGVMLRLHGEFLKALQQFKAKQPKHKSAGVTSIFKSK